MLFHFKVKDVNKIQSLTTLKPNYNELKLHVYFNNSVVNERIETVNFLQNNHNL